MKDITSVAVVGNAQYMFDRSYGKEIDRHSFIIRMNRAAILYSNHHDYYSHGSRTDMWCVWRYDEYESCTFQKPKFIMQMAFWQPCKSKVLLYDNLRYRRLEEKLHSLPSTGIMVLDWLSLFNIQQVTVYGFDWKRTPTFTDPSRSIDVHMEHNFLAEKEYCMSTFRDLGYTFRF